ncbi:tetratricopeptide repeat protein [archaeon]|nr:MAG: tetratricopeptide repeat protein [archaeon]
MVFLQKHILCAVKNSLFVFAPSLSTFFLSSHNLSKKSAKMAEEEAVRGPSDVPAPQKGVMLQTVEGKIEIAKEHKEKGNDFFKQGQFGKAKVQYGTAIAYIKGLPGRKDAVSDPMAQMMMDSRKTDTLTPELLTEITELDCVLKTNMSVCYLKLNKPHDALQAAKDALALKPLSWKALLRRGEAQIKLKMYDQARASLDEAEKHSPDPGSKVVIMNARKQISEAMKQEEQEQKKAFKNIFERAQKATGSDEK